MLVIVDSNYVGYVSAFALSQGLTYRGTRTEVIFGFLKQVVSFSSQFSPSNIAFCWDSKKSKRKEIFPEYKSNRQKDLTEAEKESLALVFDQFNELRTIVLPALGFSNVFSVDGYESDDLIAHLTSDQDPEETVVISSDNDLLQLLDNCSLYSITKRQSMNREIFRRERGIEPREWIVVKAIAGCGGDGVPGIKGVGEKSAVSYLKGRLKGKRLQDIESSLPIMKRNISLVRLPFEGCPKPKIRSNHLSAQRFKDVCGEYGMDSLLSQKHLSEWSAVISRMA